MDFEKYVKRQITYYKKLVKKETENVKVGFQDPKYLSFLGGKLNAFETMLQILNEG